jgi:flavin-dependent dehydrogenase
VAAPFGRGGGVPLRDAFAAWLKTIGLDINDFEAKAHPSLRYEPHAACSTRRVLLVGDAAGIDPLFGEGISSALAQGIVAARCALDALREQDFSFSTYERRLRDSAVGSMMYRRHVVARRLYSHLVEKVVKCSTSMQLPRIGTAVRAGRPYRFEVEPLSVTSAF